ncbi:HCNGP-like protein-domain-containing protein [Paraphoma chrysanthemicola]|uniref:HCNGP-like protein-domain-containing protein n=1 Tax=Paraphoma chrysanthemicola TaxID=798071 RepID=A0A8K0VTZ3_9PLEO|nr:HCNGP-like protein-domain-containing protein [Paraphoma chrysanthemicola]
MLGINYESSDDDEAIPATKADLTNTLPVVAPAPDPLSEPAPLEQPAASTAPLNGPAQGPTVSPPPAEEDLANDAPPGSPYTSNRALMQNLTLPTVPNFNIPPSPPGSPPQKATKKFAKFLELKKKGQHFNQRLEGSSVLRDPGHLRKLMDFAGIVGEEQYASTLSGDVAIPTVFPEWAYAEELKASQKQILKRKEQSRSKVPRDAIDFVSATRSGTSSGTGTPSGKASRQSASERIMAAAGDDPLSRSSSVLAGKRKELEHRSRDSSESRSGWKSGSRSPKRRRSRSRERR